MEMNVNYSIEDGLGVITLCRPPYNALTAPEFTPREDIAAFLETPEIKGIIVQGQGRHFCAGADPQFLAAQLDAAGSALAAQLERGKELLDTLSEASLPVAAAICGSCLGAGLELALACHFRFSARNALLGFPEADHGLIPGLGGTWSAPRLLGVGRSAALMLSGRMVGGEEALALGLVDRVCDTRQVTREAAAYLKQLTARRSPALIREVMRAIHRGRKLPRDAALAEETARFVELARRVAAEER